MFRVIAVFWLVSISTATAHSNDIFCPKEVLGANVEVVTFSRTPTGPISSIEIKSVMDFPARVLSCTALGKFLVPTRRGNLWISGGAFEYVGLKNGAGAIRGQDSVSGVSRGLSNN